MEEGGALLCSCLMVSIARPLLDHHTWSAPPTRERQLGSIRSCGGTESRAKQGMDCLVGSLTHPGSLRPALGQAKVSRHRVLCQELPLESDWLCLLLGKEEAGPQSEVSSARRG